MRGRSCTGPAWLWAWMSLEIVSGGKPCASAARATRQVNEPDPVADVEEDAALARRERLGPDRAVLVEQPALVAVEAVRDDVAGAQAARAARAAACPCR